MKKKTTEIWLNFKEKHPNTLILIKASYFYVTYASDASCCIDILGLKKLMEDSLLKAEFPHHCLDTYLPRLIFKGKKVAIAEG